MTIEIRYQLLPVEETPAQAVFQLPPDTLATATTRIPLTRAVTLVELVDGFERSVTPSHRVANMLRALVGDGVAAVTIVIARTSRATTGSTGDRRVGRRAAPTAAKLERWGLGTGAVLAG